MIAFQPRMPSIFRMRINLKILNSRSFFIDNDCRMIFNRQATDFQFIDDSRPGVYHNVRRCTHFDDIVFEFPDITFFCNVRSQDGHFGARINPELLFFFHLP